MARVRIVRETLHGNPGERRRLPVGALAVVTPARNLPADSRIKYWASPLPGRGNGWPDETVLWAAHVGVGLEREDFEPIEPIEPVE